MKFPEHSDIIIKFVMAIITINAYINIRSTWQDIIKYFLFLKVHFNFTASIDIYVLYQF